MQRRIQRSKMVQNSETIAMELTEEQKALNLIIEAKTKGVEASGFAEIDDNVMLALNDIACEADDRQKALAKEVKLYKEIFSAYGMFNKKKEFKTSKGETAIKAKVTSSIQPRALFKRLVDLGNKQLFFDVVKVSLTEAKKYMGTKELADITKKTSEEYGTVSFKKKK